MFTGLIEEKGTLIRSSCSANSGFVDIRARKVMEGTRIGDSIAVNGVCLTVTHIRSDGFMADVMPETFKISSLATLRAGDKVNLERAMSAEGRFGGHIVSGHIDGVGKISKIQKEGNAVRISIKPPKEILSLIVLKGSIAIDGISLTVAGVNDDEGTFNVSIIPHTMAETTLLDKKVNDPVNLENDMIGKYVKRLTDIR